MEKGFVKADTPTVRRTVIYISKYTLLIEWLYSDNFKEELKKNWIDSVLPVFTEEEKAKEFCWEWNYTLASR